MKIGVSASTFDALGYGRWGRDTYKKVKEHGFACSDCDVANTDLPIYTANEEEFEKILSKERKLAEEAGVTINQVHGPWRWPPRDFTQEDRRERMEKMKISIRAAAVLGSKYWVVHPIMPYDVYDAGTENANKTWEMNLVFMRELLKTAKEYGVTICLENMPMQDFSISKPEDILRLVEEIDDENFKICLDTGHVSVFKELNLADEVRRLGDKIKVLHVHDNLASVDLHLMPYYGVIDWKEFYKALADIGYDGVFSLETVPSKKLPTYLFDEMCFTLNKIAREITGDK